MSRARHVSSPRTWGGDWRASLRLCMALARGTYWALYFRLFRRNVAIRLPFLAYAPVRIAGPGKVRVGPFCSVHQNTLAGLSIVTLSPRARVTIGAHCSLGGLTIRCGEAVAMGDRSRTAYSLIQDVPFWSGSASTTAVAGSAPIRIGENAWLGGFSMVLGGSTIGDDSVLGWGATCCGATVAAGTVALGNPVDRSLPISRMLALRKPV